MTKLFFDTEFTGLHQKTTLISLGIISECGKTFYAELTDYDKAQIDDWLRQNVIANLFFTPKTENEQVDFGDGCFAYVGNIEGLKTALEEWLSQFGKVQMWSDCLSYDWVLLCEIFGHAFNMPEKVNYIPLDICTLFFAKGIDADINREEYAGTTEQLNEVYKWANKKHNAMWDAYVIRECFNRLNS